MTEGDPLPEGEQEETDLHEELSHDVHEGYHTLAHGHLSPRHRRLALLAAQGKSNKEISEELHYVGSRVSILLKNPFVAEEIERIRERIYEESIGKRLKTFAEPALNVLGQVLNDRTNKFKKSEQIDVAKWVVEKVDGKATQKYDVGENMLGVFMDRLDANKAAGRSVGGSSGGASHRDNSTPDIEVRALPERVTGPARDKTEEEKLLDWVDDFMSYEPSSVK